MHERTERAIARLLFVFCCAVPTFVTLAVLLVTWTPWYHHRQLATLQATLSRQTGLTVTIEDFDRPSPFKWSLQGIRVCEPETKLEVARVRRVEWICEDDRVGVSIHQPELQSPQLGSAWQMVHDRFLCRPEFTKIPLEMRANDLTIHSETGSMSMQDLRMLVKPRANSVHAILEFLTAGRNRFPTTVTVTRDRSTDMPKTLWDLETGPTALPCSALAGYLPLLKRLGPEAEFAGTLHWETENGGGWSVDLGGARFDQIDLTTVFENLPRSIRGKADLALDRCRIVPGQTIDLSGTVLSNRGWIQSSLLRAMNEELGFDVDRNALEDPAGEVFYELLAIHFDMQDWKLKLKGVCNRQEFYEDTQPDMAILQHGSDLNWRYLARSIGRDLPSIRIAHAIAPQHSEWVPVSKQTAGLLDLFVPPSYPVGHLGGHRIADPNGHLPPSRIKRAGHWSGNPPIKQR